MVIMKESNEAEWSVTLTMLRVSIPADRPLFPSDRGRVQIAVEGRIIVEAEAEAPALMMRSLVILS